MRVWLWPVACLVLVAGAFGETSTVSVNDASSALPDTRFSFNDTARPADAGADAGVVDAAPRIDSSGPAADARPADATPPPVDRGVVADASIPDARPPECTKASDCNDGLSCTTDACQKGRCVNTVNPNFCAIGKRWFRLDGGSWKPPKPLRLGVDRRMTLPEDLAAITPWETVTAVLRHPRDRVWWVGMTGGVAWREADRWRALSGRRWLPDDAVTGLAVSKEGDVWVATKGGVSRIYWQEMTLEQKADRLLAALRKRHLRHGLVGPTQLDRAGDPSSYTQPSGDTDGLWTAMYVAAESFRYAVTKKPDARNNAWQSLRALMFLEQVTGLPGFVARSIVEAGKVDKHSGGEWHRSKDGKWDWKGDTSSDELCGHRFAYGIYYDLGADADQKKQIVAVVGRIMGRIVDGGFLWKGPGGKPTRWGAWAPEKLNRDIRWWLERGLNSLEILSFLKVAHHITGDEKFESAARELITQHGYHMNTIRQKVVNPPSVINHSDDELAFLPYYNLLVLEKDPYRRKFYLYSIGLSWQVERPERAALFNFIFGGSTGYACDTAQAVQTLQETPMDMIDWTVTNSTRRDLQWKAYPTRFGKKQLTEVLAVYERPLMRYNGNPYVPDDGGGGMSEYEPTHFLLPYWMGRYHDLIAE